MRRSGFTMVELIFVIIIIGILATAALPKYGNVRNKAKINSELSAMSSMDGAIIATKEFRADDFHDDNISWNDSGLQNDTARGDVQATKYATINDAKKVLGKIAKKTEEIKIVGLFTSDGNGINAISDTTPYKNTVLILTGPASNKDTGVTANSELPNQDAQGKPDKNDFWVFNPNNWDINISDSGNNLSQNPTVIPAQSISIVDVNGTTSVIANIKAVRSDDNGALLQGIKKVN